MVALFVALSTLPFIALVIIFAVKAEKALGARPRRESEK